MPSWRLVAWWLPCWLISRSRTVREVGPTELVRPTQAQRLTRTVLVEEAALAGVLQQIRRHVLIHDVRSGSRLAAATSSAVMHSRHVPSSRSMTDFHDIVPRLCPHWGQPQRL